MSRTAAGRQKPPARAPAAAPDADLRRLLAVDRVVHEPARLLLLSMLASAEEVEFVFLEKTSGLSKGNLSSHLARLEQAAYLTVHKTFRGRVPSTSFRITPAGRAALHDYRARLRAALAAPEAPP